MARAIFAWELGGDLGHARRTLQVASELRALGHDVAFAFPDLTPLGASADASLEWFQAPTIPRSTTIAVAPASMSEILLNRGYGDSASIAGALRGWLGLLRLWQADMVVADYAPGALLGARAAGIRSVTIGSGFSQPVLAEPMPAFRSWEPAGQGSLQTLDSRVLASVRGAFDYVGAQMRAPASVADIFRAQADLLCTWPEVDPVGPRTGEYMGPQDDPSTGAAVEWKGEARPRVFAYLKARDARFRAIFDAVRAVAGEAIVAAPGLAPEQAQLLSSATVHVSASAVALKPVLATTDLCVCHAGPGIVTRALEAGVPLALLPQQLEQYLIARRLAAANMAVMLSPQDALPDLKAWLASALERAGMRAAAAASAVRAYKRKSVSERIAALLVQ
jgi:UDP:flavonoid glycosyltransferase YjiC (YdhE family)